jgi:hypothetical protein
MASVHGLPFPSNYQYQQGPSQQSTQTVGTGTGNGQFYNVTNNTGKTQTFVFSSEGKPLATMTLKAGETGTFESGPKTPGIRIATSGPNGETNPNQVLYEDNVETLPDGRVVHNPDVSNVDGKVGYQGDPQDITVFDGTHAFGKGTTTGSYDYPTEDTIGGDTNPMIMAQDPSSTYDIVFSN